MTDTSKIDAEVNAEIAAAAEQRRRRKRETTVETAPAMVRQRLDLMISPIKPAPTGRLLRLETLAVTSKALPDIKSELGAKHPLVIEWQRLHDETVNWLHKDGVQRALDNL